MNPNLTLTLSYPAVPLLDSSTTLPLRYPPPPPLTHRVVQPPQLLQLDVFAQGDVSEEAAARVAPHLGELVVHVLQNKSAGTTGGSVACLQ